MAGGGGASSGKFRREGTSIQEQYYNTPQNIQDLVAQNAATAGTNPVLAQKQQTLFGDLMTARPETQPGYANLTTVANQSPQEYSGKDSLFNISRIDPMSGTYEAATEAAYRKRAGDAMAMAETGPQAVQGGSMRSGIMQGQLAERLAAGRGAEVRGAQQQDIGNVLASSTGMAGIENQRTNQVLQAIQGLVGIGDSVSGRALEAGKQLDFNKLNNLQLLQLAASLQGSKVGKTTDDLGGFGSQSGWQGGMSCCFIFLQALNGMLPWYINLARRDFYTLDRRRGYKWMSTWLVPLMKRFSFMQWSVNAIVIKPFLMYGAYIYGDANSKRSSAMFAPYCKTWLALWGGLGKVIKYVSKSS
jgi:hypothetical protein